MKLSTTNTRLKRWLWFIGLYAGGIIVVGSFAYAARWLLGLPV